MKKLIKKIQDLKKNNELVSLIDSRIKSFQNVGKNDDKIFSELCFCIMTANFQAQKSWDLQKKHEADFNSASQEELMKILKVGGHRFWPQRAERIVLARGKKEMLLSKIQDADIRDWLVEKIKGLGMKESSHFLRNIGKLDYAIVDFHIVDLLVDEDLIKRPKTLTKKTYIEVEDLLRRLSEKIEMSLGELDLYLWYLETGSVLK